MVLSHYENQLVLYSKGHFKKGEFYQDLKSITAKAYGLPLEYTEQRNVYHFVLDTYFKLLEAGYIKTSMKDFLFVLYKHQSDTINCSEMVKRLMSEISVIDVKDMNLGVADREILPKRQEPVYEIRIVRLKDEDNSFIVYGEQSKVNAYMEQVYKEQEEAIVAEVPTNYRTTEMMYTDLDVVGEDNPSLEFYDAHARYLQS